VRSNITSFYRTKKNRKKLSKKGYKKKEEDRKAKKQERPFNKRLKDMDMEK